ncbi:hypothetical protein DTL42_21435 [Bremerella cremea]|uniref:Uncharacterized protein n=1 Tax=Bremerella cremea TaxID=1031537 RepID=A0A368KNP4_9BACT|nr:hypothetical protein [Bremerella cremea]RCS41140.1 hypothetical protein DTL42_21435 [Bremerella cremea]
MALKNDSARNEFTPLFTSSLRNKWLTFFLLLGTLATTGCSGCFEGAETVEERQKRLEKEETKEDFEPPKLNVLPSDDRKTRLNRVKPGHWTNVSTQMKANNFDFRGELYAYTVSQNSPVPIRDTDYYFSSTRPLALPKGKERWSDVLFYPPLFNQNNKSTRMFACDLRPAGGGRAVLVDRLPTTRMHKQEYYMVVLASSADAYQFLEATDVIRPLHDLNSAEETAPHYRLILPKVVDRVAVPENSMAWTSIAYVFWDDIDPNMLSLDQQQAMLDWLHYGGQLIISGPDSLNQLKLSFLADYLPAEDTGSIELGIERFAEINDTFVQEERIWEQGNMNTYRYTIKLPSGPLRGSELKLHPNAQYVPNTGDLVAERHVGRGRIAVTAFQIRAPDLSKNWKNFDSFFNAVLLRRPARDFKEVQGASEIVTLWADREAFNDPRRVTSLRFMSRDLSNNLPANQLKDAKLLVKTSPDSSAKPEEGTVTDLEELRIRQFAQRTPSQNNNQALEEQALREAIQRQDPNNLYSGFGYDDQSGVAGWNDKSGISAAARECLRDAAGISIPNGNFVLRVTAGYLLVLVPLNWLVFWLIGRVEWAWIAAPVIAIFGALFVIKLAELDIGFARSRTEIAFMEVQPNYHRAHLTRFTSLYTSLSTSYDMLFTESTAVALPFGRSQDSQSNQARRFNSGFSEVQYRQEGNDIKLSGLQVASNSSTMVHSEYFLSSSSQPVFQWNVNQEGQDQLTYGSSQTLHDVGIVRRNARTKAIEVAWLGDLEPDSKQKVTFSKPQDEWELFPQWLESPVLSLNRAAGEVNLRHLLNAVKEVKHLNPGETRLIGWTDEDMPGLTISPASSQRTIRTMVLGHLSYGEFPVPKADLHTRRVGGQEPAQMQAIELDLLEEATN